VEPVDIALDCIAAWKRRDLRGGAYTDPGVPHGLSRSAIANDAAGQFAGFPDLVFDVLDAALAGDSPRGADRVGAPRRSAAPTRGDRLEFA
jgi:hypothetical protein